MIFGLGAAALLAGCAGPAAPGRFDLAAYERPRVVAQAEAALGDAPRTIVAAVNPRSAGGPHDWSSDADYWWPDPKNPGGPYVSRDGLTNPGNFTAHRELMLAFVRDFGALAAAYKLTGEERYAAGAVRQLHAWFVDPATRMNPNLQYAQAVRGRYTGRSYGVIDTVHFAEVALGAEALRGSRAFTPEEDAAVCGWFRQYLDWLQTSPHGSAEGKAANNHGTCWVLQAAAFAHLVGDQAVLEQCRLRLLDDLLPNQMAPDGSFPRELARTKPYGYSIFNLDVMTALAQVLSRPGENLIDYTLPDGRSLAKGIAFLAPSLADKGRWPKAPDAMFWNDWPVRQPALIFGYLATGRGDWLATWRKLNPDPVVGEIRRNFPIRQPVLWVGLTAAAPAGRETLNFDPDWRFLRDDPGVAAARPGFDDSRWARVSAPHTFNDVDTFNHWSPRTMAGQREQWSGRTWYRKAFVLPASARGRKAYLEFEGVRQVAEVYLNGRYLGASKNGFVPFGFDLTPYLRTDGGANVLAVMCDNRFMADPEGPAGGQNLAQISAANNTRVPESEDAIQANQIPWNNPRWHPPMGGIYRNVYLHLTDPLHFSLPLYDYLRTEGPYVYGSDFSGGAAAVNVELPVENGRGRAAAVSATVSVLDATGRTVLQLRSESTVAAGGRALLRLRGVLDDPRLWEPAYPYLYRAVCRLEAEGAAADSVEIPFGLRTAVWTTTAGFFLNGHHVKLHGWGQRPTDEWPGLGDAQPDWLHAYTLNLAREAGGNFWRWGHAAGGPAEIAMGDRLGFVTDQPGVDGESDTVGAAWKIRAEAFRDLIVYYRNHPSILLWEAGNQKVSPAHAEEMRAIFRRYDPHGGRAEAYRRADQADAPYMDVTIGTEGSHEVGTLPVVEGEYDREESPRRIWDRWSPPDFGYPQAQGQAYTPFASEDFAVHEVAQYVRKLGAPAHSGGANWIFSDSTSGGRVDCETARDSGEVDGVRLPKEAYYVCAVMFGSAPAAHLVGHWTYPAGTRKPVYVASNGDDVELFLNGRSLGHGRVSDRYLFTFPDVAWAPGELKAVATRGGRPWASDVRRTAGPPVALRLTPITAPSGLRADGSDIALFDVEAVDARGERCPTFQQRVDFECEGPATWRGGWNSGKVDSINHPWLDLEAGVNRVAVRAGFAPGAITVRARCPGLAPAAATVHAQPAALGEGSSAELPELPYVPLPSVRPLFAAQAIPAEPASAAAPRPGRTIASFSYSGPTTIAHVETGAADGRDAYVDRDWAFAGLPAGLRGADWVQAAQADAAYSALDFIVVSVPKGAVVTVAHDDRGAPPPDWLRRQFAPRGQPLLLHGRSLTPYVRRAAKDETLTLGSNADGAAAADALMYLVFVSPPAP